MLHAKSHPEQKPFDMSKTHSLADAAQLAADFAAAEHLPIAATVTDAIRWHSETILKTVPVYGKRGHFSERVPAGAELQGDKALTGDGEWTNLEVNGRDFEGYLEWLRTFW